MKAFLAALLLTAGIPLAAAKPDDFATLVKPFFQTHCVDCHGPDKSKGKITVHTLNGNDLIDGRDLEHWETILDVLIAGEMPPEDEPQPPEDQRQAVASWIDSALRAYVDKASRAEVTPTARRLTNVEYENTIRDLMGFELSLIDKLPNDPEVPYHFINTAEYMLMGPEQLVRYRENARRIMAAAIVDPGEPEVHKSRREWTDGGVDRGLGIDEIGIWGNRRHSAADGLGLKTYPKNGEFRIRFQASAILPEGIPELPLRIAMGYPLNSNIASISALEVDTVRLTTSPDNPQTFELRGRIENFPAQPSDDPSKPDKMHVTPQNAYDDGTLNDGKRNLAMPRVVLNWIEFEAPVTDVWPPAHHTRILFNSPLRKTDPDAYVRAVIERFASRAFRRPATTAEIDKYFKIYQLVLPDKGSFEPAIRETLAMVLISPQFLYHTVADDQTTRQYELASKLSYFLWASMPDPELLQLAAEEKLDSDTVIAKQVQRLLADDRAHGFVENFTDQWLSVAKLKTIPINRQLFPRFLYYVAAGERAGTEIPNRPTVRDYMHEETIAFIGELIKRNAPANQLIDSDFAMLNQRLAAHYGVDGVFGNHLRPVPIKSDHRIGGVLTHGSILIGNGTGSAPHPIYRAVFLREAILGDKVAPPPAEVPALVDTAGESAENALSIKDLLALHREKESCNDCHVRLDPWGIPFERYNAIGKYQPKVPKEGTRVSGFNQREHSDLAGYLKYLDSINTEVIEADARVPHGPELDGMQDLKRFLIRRRIDDVGENLIRRLMTYALGRELTYRDRFAIEELRQHHEPKGYPIQSIITSICQSNLFRDLPNNDQARRE